MTDKTAQQVADGMAVYLAFTGPIGIFHSDNGGEFKGAL